MSKSEEYRAKALAAYQAAQAATDEAIRSSYEEVARNWLEMARQVEGLVRRTRDQPTSKTKKTKN
jgi:hypothetical protein